MWGEMDEVKEGLTIKHGFRGSLEFKIASLQGWRPPDYAAKMDHV